MAKSSEHGYVMYHPSAARSWAPCVRISDGGAHMGAARLYSREDDLPKNAELLEIEHLAPGIAEVKSVSGRPAMVNSRAFREGWERLFDPNRRKDLAQA
jgi:hypothetical protein